MDIAARVLLRELSGICLLRYLERGRRIRSSAPACRQALDALDSLTDYLCPRLAITEYVKYRRRGFVIGLGMMTSTGKQSVEQRLRAGDPQWSEPDSVVTASPIARRLNRTWGAFQRLGPLQRAA